MTAATWTCEKCGRTLPERAKNCLCKQSAQSEPTTRKVDVSAATTSSRVRDLGGLLLTLGVIVGLLALAKLLLSQDKLDNMRINEGPGAVDGIILRCWIFTVAGAIVAAVGGLLMFLSPKGNRSPRINNPNDPTVVVPLEHRLAKVASLLAEGTITEAEYQEQRRRILDQV